MFNSVMHSKNQPYAPSFRCVRASSNTKLSGHRCKIFMLSNDCSHSFALPVPISPRKTSIFFVSSTSTVLNSEFEPEFVIRSGGGGGGGGGDPPVSLSGIILYDKLWRTYYGVRRDIFFIRWRPISPSSADSRCLSSTLHRFRSTMFILVWGVCCISLAKFSNCSNGIPSLPSAIMYSRSPSFTQPTTSRQVSPRSKLQSSMNFNDAFSFSALTSKVLLVYLADFALSVICCSLSKNMKHVFFLTCKAAG